MPIRNKSKMLVIDTQAPMAPAPLTDVKQGISEQMTKAEKERIRQARNIANGAYIANQRLGTTPKQAREASQVFVPRDARKETK